MAKNKTRLFRCTECGMVFGWVGISDPIDQLCGDCMKAGNLLEEWEVKV